MLAALATIWILFSVWLLGPHVGMSPRAAARLVGSALVAELVAAARVELRHRAACVERACAPLAQAAGVAARIDLPVLAVVLVAAALRTATARQMGGPSDTA